MWIPLELVKLDYFYYQAAGAATGAELVGERLAGTGVIVVDGNLVGTGLLVPVEDPFPVCVDEEATGEVTAIPETVACPAGAV